MAGLYEMYAETFPDYHSAYWMLGRAYAAQGRRERAVAAFRRALEICPGYVYAEEQLRELAAPVDPPVERDETASAG